MVPGICIGIVIGSLVMLFALAVARKPPKGRDIEASDFIRAERAKRVLGEVDR